MMRYLAIVYSNAMRFGGSRRTKLDISPLSETDRIAGVMRYRKRLDREVADGELVAGRKQSPSGKARQRAPDAFGGGAIAIQRKIMGAAQDTQSGGMIRVLVRQQDRVDILQSDPDRFQPLGDLAGAEPGVDQEPGFW